jgi:16S rRNA processing protein RimM
MKEIDNWIEAGAVMRPHGIKGEVVVDIKGDLLELVVDGMEVRTTTRRGEERILVVEQAREHKGRLIVWFADFDSRDAAESLRGYTLWLSREQVGELGDDRWFVQDILGVDVYTEEGEHLGQLAEVMHQPANDVYVVRGADGEILLPATEEVVREVDVVAAKMVVHLIEGLR